MYVCASTQVQNESLNFEVVAPTLLLKKKAKM